MLDELDHLHGAAPARSLLQLTQCPACRCVVVEDSHIGLRAAKGAGMRFVHACHAISRLHMCMHVTCQASVTLLLWLHP